MFLFLVINVVKRRTNSDWPTETELKEAARAIVNVWIVYDLDLDQVINGTIGDVTERSLSSDEIFFIANAARDSGMTYEAITWFEYLLQRLESFSSQTFKTSSLYRRLALTYREVYILVNLIIKINYRHRSVLSVITIQKLGLNSETVKYVYKENH